MTTHYSTPRIIELLDAAEGAVNVADPASVVRVIVGNAVKSPAPKYEGHREGGLSIRIWWRARHDKTGHWTEVLALD